MSHKNAPQDWTDDAKEKTEQWLRNYYHGNKRALLHQIHPKFISTGIGNANLMIGAESFEKYLREIELKDCEIQIEQCATVCRGKHLFFLTGLFVIISDRDKSFLSQQEYTFAFLWSHLEEVLQLLFVNISDNNKEELNEGQKIVLEDNKRQVHFRRIEELLYLESDDNNCSAHFTDQSYIRMYQTLGSWQEKFPCFVRIHRSLLVNPQHIQSLSKENLILDDGTNLPVSRRRYEEVKKHLLEPFTL